jgi:hypothetical protein
MMRTTILPEKAMTTLLPHLPFALALIAAPLLCSTARAQADYVEDAPEFSLGIGYANVTLDGSPVIDGEGAIRFEPTLSFSPFRPLPQLRLGTDVGMTLVLDNSSRTIISGDGGLIFAGSSDIPLWLVEPELRLSWRQYLGDDRGSFIEPGVAGGIAFGFLDLDSDDASGDSYDADDSSLFGRIFLRAGARVTGGVAGIEGSWTTGDTLDFGGNASGDLSEFYIGIFGAISF